MKITSLVVLFVVSSKVSAFWDLGTTTADPALLRWDALTVRRSKFRWQRTENTRFRSWYTYWDWDDIERRRKLFAIAGISIDFINITTGTILNKRTLITSANPFDPYMSRQKELRIWALGRNGYNDTPFRYRVWRVTRIFPKSLNPEHCHGPYCTHSPRHDVAIIHSLDQIYVYAYGFSTNWQYAARALLTSKKQTLDLEYLWFTGSGYEYLQHIYENYKIFYAMSSIDDVVDCSKYLPKWWGKFICLINRNDLPGIQNGGGLFDGETVVGIGCFEIRYNEDRIMVFTDLRYYVDFINYYAYVRVGEYYEYAYSPWFVVTYWNGWSSSNEPYIPAWDLRDYGMYPLG